jgi:hypothetical protein
MKTWPSIRIRSGKISDGIARLRRSFVSLGSLHSTEWLYGQGGSVGGPSASGIGDFVVAIRQQASRVVFVWHPKAGDLAGRQVPLR